jgi:hypothetical protein
LVEKRLFFVGEVVISHSVPDEADEIKKSRDCLDLPFRYSVVGHARKAVKRGAGRGRQVESRALRQ